MLDAGLVILIDFDINCVRVERSGPHKMILSAFVLITSCRYFVLLKDNINVTYVS
jgi:hypothetical protein